MRDSRRSKRASSSLPLEAVSGGEVEAEEHSSVRHEVTCALPLELTYSSPTPLHPSSGSTTRPAHAGKHARSHTSGAHQCPVGIGSLHLCRADFDARRGHRDAA